MMFSFSDWFYLDEGMGATLYRPPRDAEPLLFDFYAIELLKSETSPGEDPELSWEINYAYKILLPYLKNHLLRMVSNSILSEIRHYPDKKKFKGIKFYQDIRQAFLNRNADYYDSATLAPLIEEMRKLFLDRGWKEDYGGKPWSYGCTAWLKLYHASSLNDIQVWIDHLYDLQHNTGSLLNKNPQYRGRWLRDALEIKKHMKDIDDLLPSASLRGNRRR